MNAPTRIRLALGERPAAAPGQGGPPTLYPIRLIQAGEANGLTFAPEVLRAAAPLFAGAPVFLDHASPQDLVRPGGRSVRDLAGEIASPAYNAPEAAIDAQLALFYRPDWLAALIANAGDRPYFGLSADLWLAHTDGVVNAITSVESVDIVIRPAAGGKFLYAKEPLMTTQPNVPTPQVASERRDLPQPPTPTQSPPAETLTGREMLKELARLKLANSGLPAETQAAIRAQMGDEFPDVAHLDLAIQAYKDALAHAAERSTIKNVGAHGPIALRTELDRIRLAFERLMGVEETAEHRAVPRLSGIRELYDLLTGDHERHGLFRPERVSFANATTSTMADVVANVLNKVMLRAFEMRPQWWKPFVYEEDFPNMNDAKWLTVAGFSDLSAVSEGNAYTEKTWSDNQETSAFVKYGNYIGITLEMIDRDDVAAVRSIPRRLAHAAYRTLSQKISDIFTANSGTGPQLSDTYYLFDAARHGNLGSSALDADSWDATLQAMFKQTELGSGKRLGIRARYCLVPIELEKAALTIFTSDREPGTANNDANVRRMPDSVITVPEWTDANNWAAAAAPTDLEGVCIGYRFGRAPELFVADDERAGSMFTNDELRIKARFIFTVGIGDYRALYKHNVA